MANSPLLFAIIAAIAISFASPQAPPSPDDSFERVRSRFDIERIGNLTTQAVAGLYGSSPDEVREHIVPFSGNELYLFPDRSYIDLFWSDIPPRTIQDKGHWVVSDGGIDLTSDSEVTWSPVTERRYLLLRRHSHPQEILAIGVKHDIPYFEKNAGSYPEFQLLIGSKTRIAEISLKSTARLKQKLMREAWRPDFYTRKNLRDAEKSRSNAPR